MATCSQIQTVEQIKCYNRLPQGTINMPETIWENVLRKQETCGRMRKVRLNKRIKGKVNRLCLH